MQTKLVSGDKDSKSDNDSDDEDSPENVAKLSGKEKLSESDYKASDDTPISGLA